MLRNLDLTRIRIASKLANRTVKTSWVANGSIGSTAAKSTIEYYIKLQNNQPL